ncbi:MAG: hypothetical protein QM528_08520, partial [Phycisphaerales bacterium]|nr:hypothetical protein [Phycisphaerales bacterium]
MKYKNLIFISMLMLVNVGYMKTYSQTHCTVFVRTTNQTAHPTNDSSNLSSNSTVNQVLAEYECVSFKKAFKNSVRPEAIYEFVIYAKGNGDSLKVKLNQTGLFDTIINRYRRLSRNLLPLNNA